MDQRLWQTPESIDILHSSHMCKQTVLLCGNTAKQCRRGMFQDSDFAGDLEDSKSTSGGTLCVFGSHIFVSISWMFKKQTSVSHSSTGIRNHPFGRSIEIGRDSRSICGIWLFLSLETQFRLLIDRGNPLWTVTKITDQTNDLKEQSTCWIILIVFPQTSNLLIKKLCCMCLRTTKQWLRWLSKGGVPQWDMCPGPTELRVIGYSIESIWIQKNPNQVHRHQKPTGRHSNQRRFHTWWVESFVVLVQYQPCQSYSLFWSHDKNYNKIQEKNESQRNRDQWWAILQ